MQTGAEGVAHRANHAVHLLTAGAWIGGLAPFAMCLGAYRDDDLRHDAARAMMGFSFSGQFVVAGLVLTGAVNIALTVRPPADPADHALPRYARRKNRSRCNHDLACGL